MKFIIIGSNSFSGSHFISYCLDEGHQVIGVSRSKEIDNVFLPYKWIGKNKKVELYKKESFVFHQIDLNKNNKELLNLIDYFEPNIIVNFAAQGMVAESWKNPTDWYRTNVLAQVALHDELRKKAFLSKYVHVTTPEVYGSTDEGWIKENTPFNPSTPYAVSRAACDLHLQSFYKAYRFPVIFTRSANVYGPGQQLYRIIPRTILSARTGKKMFLHGGGISKRSFIHIDDVVKATMTLALNGESGTSWHLSTTETITIKELVAKILSLTGKNLENIVEESTDRLGKDQSYMLDSSKMREKFNWTEKISLAEGLGKTIDWVDENISLLKQLNWDYQHKS